MEFGVRSDVFSEIIPLYLSSSTSVIIVICILLEYLAIQLLRQEVN